MELLTINQTAEKYHLPGHMLRQMQKRGELPGFYSASRFYVHTEMLLDKLDADAKASMTTSAAIAQ